MTRREALATMAALQTASVGPEVRYLEWNDLSREAQRMEGSPGRSRWDPYIQLLDASVRARVRRGAEDSICELILTGRAFTTLPGVRSGASAWTGTGLTPAARARVHAFVAAMQRPDAPERARWAATALGLQGKSAAEQEKVLTNNMTRFARQSELEEEEGLRLDAGWLVNHAVDDMLKSLRDRGSLPKQTLRVGVVGPGLDVAGNPPGFDFYPMQTLQPFATMSSLIRLGLAKLGELKVTGFDLNPAVLEHIGRLAKQGREGQGRTLALVREGNEDSAAGRYWEQMLSAVGGTMNGTLGQKIPAGVSVRLVAVRPEALAALDGLDLNVVCQTVRGGTGYDLVIATGVLGFYAPFQQLQGYVGMGLLLRNGGVLITDAAAPAGLSGLNSLGSLRTSGTELWAWRK